MMNMRLLLSLLICTLYFCTGDARLSDDSHASPGYTGPSHQKPIRPGYIATQSCKAKYHPIPYAKTAGYLDRKYDRKHYSLVKPGYTCRIGYEKDISSKLSQCPNPVHTGLAGYHQQVKSTCPDRPCAVEIRRGYNKCFGRVKLSRYLYFSFHTSECVSNAYCNKPFHYTGQYHGRSSTYDGYTDIADGGYRSGNPYPEKHFGAPYKRSPYRCSCRTETCDVELKTCFQVNYKHYEGKVTIKVPCGCSCFKDDHKYPVYYPKPGVHPFGGVGSSSHW